MSGHGPGTRPAKSLNMQEPSADVVERGPPVLETGGPLAAATVRPAERDGGSGLPQGFQEPGYRSPQDFEGTRMTGSERFQQAFKTLRSLYPLPRARGGSSGISPARAPSWRRPNRKPRNVRHRNSVLCDTAGKEPSRPSPSRTCSAGGLGQSGCTSGPESNTLPQSDTPFSNQRAKDLTLLPTRPLEPYFASPLGNGHHVLFAIPLRVG